MLKLLLYINFYISLQSCIKIFIKDSKSYSIILSIHNKSYQTDFKFKNKAFINYRNLYIFKIKLYKHNS